MDNSTFSLINNWPIYSLFFRLNHILLGIVESHILLYETSSVHRFGILSIITLQWSMSSLFCYKRWVLLPLPLSVYLCFDQNHIAITACWILMLKLWVSHAICLNIVWVTIFFMKLCTPHPFDLASPLHMPYITCDERMWFWYILLWETNPLS